MQETTLEEIVELLLSREVNGQNDHQSIRLSNEMGKDLICEVYGVAGLIGGVEVEQDIVDIAGLIFGNGQ